MMKLKLLMCIIICSILVISVLLYGKNVYIKNKTSNIEDNISITQNTTVESYDSSSHALDNIDNVSSNEELSDDIVKNSMFDLSNRSLKEKINVYEFTEGVYKVIQMDDGWKYEFHVFKNDEYQNSRYLQYQYGYDPNLYLEKFNSHVWLKVDELIAKGTGILEKDEVWYDITVKSLPEILRFTKISIYESENYPMNQEYNAEVVSTSKNGNKISIVINSVLNILNPETDNLMLSVEKEKEYILDDSDDGFIKEFFPKTDLKFYTEIPNLEFLNEYKDKLAELLNSDDIEKRLWARNIIEFNQEALENIDNLRNIVQ